MSPFQWWLKIVDKAPLFCEQRQMLSPEFVFRSVTNNVKHLLFLRSYEYDIQKYIVAYVTIRKTNHFNNSMGELYFLCMPSTLIIFYSH